MARRVLIYGGMRIGLAAVIIASLSATASAGTYVGLGIGSEASASGELQTGQDLGSMDGYERSTRLMIGTRISKLSIEGQGSRFDTSIAGNGYQSTQLGLGLKLNLPLGNNFEFFGKGGIQRTWLSPRVDRPALEDADGSGYFMGAGFEYRLNLGLTSASMFVDYQRAATDFTSSDTMVQWDGTASMWTLGAIVSL